VPIMKDAMRVFPRVRFAVALSIVTLLLVSCSKQEPVATRPQLGSLPASGTLLISGHPENSQYLVEGWYPIQPDVAWSNGHAKVWLSFTSDQLKNYKTIGLNLQAAVASLPIDAVIRTGGRDYSFPISNAHGQATAVAEVPIAADGTGYQEFEITTSKTVVPAQFGMGPDQRVLGVGLSKIQLLPGTSGR